MKVIILGQPAFFDCVPRVYPKIGDVLSLDLRDELKKVVISPKIEWMTAEKLRISIIGVPEEFISRSKFEIKLKNHDEIIYLGKLLVLDADTDVQNYSNEKQSNSRFTYNE